MCVTQFREYCKASSFKRTENIGSNDRIHTERGSFYCNSETWYVTDQKELQRLARLGNVYAREEVS